MKVAKSVLFLVAAQRSNLNGSGQTFRIDLDSQVTNTFALSKANNQTIAMNMTD